MIKVSETNLIKPIDKELIELCDNYGYKAVSICVHDPLVEASTYWSSRGVKFATGEPDETTKFKGTDSPTGDGWPAIWRIIDKLGGSAGCGNSNQKQLKDNHPFSEVSYVKKDGEWYISDASKLISETSKKYNI